MNKGNLLTLGISVVVLATVTVVLLLFLLPQPSILIEAGGVEYNAIKKTDYVYKQTKELTREALVKEYSISTDEMDKFKKNNQYVSGNSDPFTPIGYEEEVEGEDKNTTGNTSGNKNTNTNSTNKNNNTTNKNNAVGGSYNSNTSVSEDTTQKITNSNDGVANPPSTNK